MQGLKQNSMRRIILIAGLIIFSLNVSMAQQRELKAEGGGTGSLYITHTVAAKEGLFSIARLYAINPKDLAAYNGLDANQGLAIGQVLKVPLNSTNFSQELNASERQGAVPVYHIVKEKEGMYRVSLNHNKVPYEAIKKWNKLPGEALTVGQKLIVGYLVGSGSAVATTRPVTTPEPPVQQTETRAVVEEKKAEVATTRPVTTTQQETVVKKEDPKPVVRKEETKPIQLPKGSSYFQQTYESELRSGRTVKTATLSGAIFKSTSGWQDGKYYILMNQVQPGTIVKVTNIGTNKTIFAKVLGEVPDLRQNSGISFRLSNAGAAELGVKEDGRFNVEISY